MLLEETPAVLSLGKLCEDHEYTCHWPNQRSKTISHQKMARALIAIFQTLCCSLSLVCRRVRFSTTPTPTSSSSQDSAFDVSRYTENPVPERSGSEELEGNPLHRSTETSQNTRQNEGREELQSDQLHVLTDWLQDFREMWLMKVVL